MKGLSIFTILVILSESEESNHILHHVISNDVRGEPNAVSSSTPLKLKTLDKSCSNDR